MSDAGMIIVGAGEAGARAAAELSSGGYKGSVTLIGKERLAPYERPPLSKSTLMDAEEPTPKTILDETKLREQEIKFISDNPVLGIDRDNHTIELKDGRSLKYERLLLA